MLKPKELRGRHIESGQPIRLTLDGPLIASVEPDDHPPSERNPCIAPGLVDLQVNGYDGVDFTSSELRPEQVQHVARRLAEGGVTAFLATVTTQSPDVLYDSMRKLRAAMDHTDLSARLIGIHLEGPYVSPEDGPRGAHPKAHCRPPDWEEFQRLQQAAGGAIRLVTLSPEYPEAITFIRRLVEDGVVAAIGHTAARDTQIAEAVAAGARLSTHLGNGAHAVLPRHPNYLWQQLAEDRLWASLIVDGFHLPPEVVKVFVRAKTVDRIILVSDVTAMAGQPPGYYAETPLGAIEVLEDGRLVIAGQRTLLAGASRPLIDGVLNIRRWAGLTDGQAWRTASDRPLELLGERSGGLAPGQPADLVQVWLDPPRAAAPIQAVYCRGRLVAGTPWTR